MEFAIRALGRAQLHPHGDTLHCHRRFSAQPRRQAQLAGRILPLGLQMVHCSWILHSQFARHEGTPRKISIKDQEQNKP